MIAASSLARAEIAAPAPAAWYGIDDVVAILNKSERSARAALAGVRSSQVRLDPSYAGNGRPPLQYHYTSLPQLWAHWRTLSAAADLPAPEADEPAPDPQAPAAIRAACPSTPDAADVALAQLRLSAVNEYWARVKSGLSRDDAAGETCRDWARTPRTRSVATRERIGRWQRGRASEIRLAGFSPRTLRAWVAAFAAEGVGALVPRRKGRTGRPRVEIPAELLTFVCGMSVSTARADIAKAVQYARDHWPSDTWPSISIRTWERAVRGVDPGKRFKLLGQGGARAFANGALPDIERDWDQLKYDELWEVDDVQIDFYCHSAVDPTQLLRPYIYGIRRISTRQWVACVVSEVPIAHSQVASMLGFAFAMQGMPEHLTFERGIVALSAPLAELLDGLGIRHHQASMDGGKPVWSGAPAADINKGHSQSKAVFEANVRRFHGILWDQVGQVGADERDTAPQYMERLKALSVTRLREKLPPLLPVMNEARAFIWSAMQRDNSMPHTGLQKIWDAAANSWRHQSPDERALQIRDQGVRKMSPTLIPAFAALGRTVPVTRNGVQIGRDRHGRACWYGRDDRELLDMAGTSVTVYMEEGNPDVAYIQQLGRVVCRYDREAPFAERDAEFDTKHGVAKQWRNQFERLMAGALATEGAIVEQTISLADPAAATRPASVVSHDGIARRVAAIREAAAILKEADKLADARFDLANPLPGETTAAQESADATGPLPIGHHDRRCDPRRAPARAASGRSSLRAMAARHAAVAGAGFDN
ncbi:MAG: hypothetical protein PHR35_04150 [Kiritimatiellae bacterium]|nr:hypothetical protein [Kiritimatiellia bacterium]